MCGGKKIKIGFPHNFSALQSRPIAKRLIDHNKSGLNIFEVDVVRHVFHQALQQKSRIVKIVFHVLFLQSCLLIFKPGKSINLKED
jgi:hypothetical protein